jgi:hypothetical protein
VSVCRSPSSVHSVELWSLAWITLGTSVASSSPSRNPIYFQLKSQLIHDQTLCCRFFALLLHPSKRWRKVNGMPLRNASIWQASPEHLSISRSRHTTWTDTRSMVVPWQSYLKRIYADSTRPFQKVRAEVRLQAIKYCLLVLDPK